MAGRPGRSIPQPATPARKGKPGSGGRPRRPTVLSRVFARPGVIVAGATFAAVMTGIVANALLLQKGHHPSPLFSPTPAEVTATGPSAPQVPVPPPAPRQVAAESAPPAAAEPPAPPEVAPAPAAVPPASHAAKKAPGHLAPAHTAVNRKAVTPPHPDLIGQLLGRQGH